jgi:hypothetical protein
MQIARHFAAYINVGRIGSKARAVATSLSHDLPNVGTCRRQAPDCLARIVGFQHRVNSMLIDIVEMTERPSSRHFNQRGNGIA